MQNDGQDWSLVHIGRCREVKFSQAYPPPTPNHSQHKKLLQWMQWGKRNRGLLFKDQRGQIRVCPDAKTYMNPLLPAEIIPWRKGRTGKRAERILNIRRIFILKRLSSKLEATGCVILNWQVLFLALIKKGWDSGVVVMHYTEFSCRKLKLHFFPTSELWLKFKHYMC